MCMYISYIVRERPQKFSAKCEWHFSGRLTFSNTRGRPLVEYTALGERTLSLHVPETLSPLSKSRIS